MADAKYQTLSEFIEHPFGSSGSMQTDRRLAHIYQEMNSAGEIVMAHMTMIENSYYYHLQLPSESQKKQGNEYAYDVVIRFFPDNPSVIKEDHLRNYKIQFYSNSPSFMYQYAYLYHKNGFLIEELYGKTDTDFINKPPTKRNPDMKVNYDKSIYVVCRYLADRQFRWLFKHGPITQRKVPVNRFFREISDFNSVKFDQALFAEERRLEKELDKKAVKDAEKEENNGKKKPQLSSVKNKVTTGINVKKKITATKKTAKIIRGRKTTRRK